VSEIADRLADVSTALAELAQRVHGMESALVLQATEYERRLEGLDHEAARIGAILDESVTSEQFDDYVRAERSALDAALANLDEKIRLIAMSVAEITTTEQTRSASGQRLTRMVIAGVGFILTAAAILLQMLR